MDNELVELVEISKDMKILDIEKRLNDAENHAKLMVVESEDGAKDCSNEIGFVKGFIKSANSRKLELTAPYRDAVSKFNNQVKNIELQAKGVLGILEEKFIKYRQEREAEEKIRFEAEKARLIAQEEARRLEAEKDILDQAEKHNIPSLADQAIELNEESEARQREIEITSTVIKSTTRGEAFTTSLKKTWKAEVDDMKEFLAWVLKTERFELIEASKSGLNILGKTKGKNAPQDKNQFIENGIKYYQVIGTSSR